MTIRGYRLAADWSGVGTFDGTLEDITTPGEGRLRAEPDLQFAYGRDTAQSQAPMAAGTMTFAVNNIDKAMSPENAASPIAGLILPGRAVTLTGAASVGDISDTFGRAASSGWGSTDTGQAWTITGTAADYSVASGVGRQSNGAVNSLHTAVVNAGTTDPDITCDVSLPITLATGANVTTWVCGRLADLSNYYVARLNLLLSGQMTLEIAKRVAGSISTVASARPVGANTSGLWWRIRFQLDRGRLRAKAWVPGTDPEPDDWTVTGYDTALTSGTNIGVLTRLETGNTNTLPVVFSLDLVTSTLRPMWAGVIEDINVDNDTAGRPVTFDCLDAWGRPGAENLSTPLYQGLRTGQAIGLVLDAIGWTGDRDLDPGATIMPWWWVEGDDAATAVEKIVNSEGPPSVAYVEGGTFVYRDRHHRVLRPDSTTVQATYAAPASAYPGSFTILKGMGYDRGHKSVVNTAQFVVDVRQRGPQTQVWTSDAVYSVTDGDTLIVDVQASDPFFDAVPPEEGVDFQLNFGAVTTALSRTSGQSATVFVTAVGGDAQLSGLAVRASPVTVARAEKVYAEDPTSIATYGRKTWPKEAPWAGPDDASSIAQHVVARFATPQPTVTLTIANVNAAHTAQIMGRRMSDRIRVVHDGLGLDREFWVERVEHTIRKLGAIHRLTLGCQIAGPDQPDNVFTFNVVGAGFNDGVFGYAGINNASKMFVFDGVSGQRFDEGAFAY